jgi:hypothetical protein
MGSSVGPNRVEAVGPQTVDRADLGPLPRGGDWRVRYHAKPRRCQATTVAGPTDVGYHAMGHDTYRVMAGFWPASNDKLREWEDYYNYHRPHGALGGETPYERLVAKTRAQVSPAS